MKISKIFISIFTLFFFFSTTSAQEFVRVKKADFEITEDGLKEAMKNIRKGNRKYRADKRGTYQMAIELYNQAFEYNEDNAALNYLIGVCYLNTGEKSKAYEFIDNAYFIKEDLAEDILYQRGLAAMYIYEFDDAVDDFNDYLESLDERKLQKVKMKVDKRIDECKNALELKKKPVRCFIDNLGEGINTAAPEYSSVFFFQDSLLYFTSRRESTLGGKRSPMNAMYMEDVYRSEYKNGSWQAAEHPEAPLNTKHNDAVVDVSNNGKELCIYRGHKGAGDLFYMTFTGEIWEKAEKIRKIDEKHDRESSVSVTPDSLFMFFISDRKGSIGGTDIWVSMKTQDKRKWQKPQNLGTTVNTKYDEETVEISNDGKTLYFSSKGHNTMGGYDVFKTTRNDDGTWSEPENIGYPINTPYDDVFFMLTENEKFGYYGSVQEDNYGDLDLYEVVFLGPEKPTDVTASEADEQLAYLMEPVSETEIEKPVNIKVVQLSKVTGIITDAYSGKPIEAQLELVDNATGKVQKVVTSYGATGKYTVTLPPGKDYALTAGAQDYFFHSENFVIADTSIHEVIHKDIQLQPMGVGAKIVLNNVFFDSGKSKLRPESFIELDRLIKIIKLYPRLKIEISGHTDSRGSARFNQQLSQKRAQSVVNYITEKGVNLAQIIAKGYGEEEPRADNVTANGRQLNRRVEAKILEK